jgi:hypothetical protein
VQPISEQGREDIGERDGVCDALVLGGKDLGEAGGDRGFAGLCAAERLERRFEFSGGEAIGLGGMTAGAQRANAPTKPGDVAPWRLIRREDEAVGRDAQGAQR